MRARSLILVVSAVSASAFGAAPTPEQAQFFESKVRPILAAKCYKCHSVEEGKVKGGLTLDTKDGTLKGGDTGPAVTPGNPDKSLLIQAILYTDSDLQMPPKGEKLTDKEIADLTAWVTMGAPDPRGEAKNAKLTGLTAAARKHWAFVPPKKSEIPAVTNRAWCTTQVDAFVLKKLEEKGMTPSPPANRETLLRRATFDLLGIPPNPDEIAAFVQDPSPDTVAFAKVVDRLLASPHYGERWGRYWLDSARYADTTGGDRNDRDNDYRYPYAWTYRDWVVKAFNDDLPYDQFVMQQLAADKLPRNKPENLAALGFLTVGERFPNQNDIINDRIDVVTKGFLGLTVSCARCHDHMFDPVSIKDYYALHGVFSSITEPAEKPIIRPPANEALKVDFEQKLMAIEDENRAKYYKAVEDASWMFRQKVGSYVMAGMKRRGNASESDMQEADRLVREDKLDVELMREVQRDFRKDHPVMGPFARLVEGGTNFKATVDEIAENKAKRYNPIIATAFKGANPQKFDDVASIYAKVFASVEPKTKEVIKACADAKKAPIAGVDPAMIQILEFPYKLAAASELNTEGLRRATDGWPQQMQGRAGIGFGRVNELLLTHDGAPVRAMVVADLPTPRDSSVFLRGQAETRGDVVPRRSLEVLSDGRPQPFRQGSGRLELAQSIANPRNPLTARVVVNRVWMHHFGQGFVRTTDDIGTQSEKPSHPELLDYLSAWFVEQGWSLKKLHKLVMLSKVYQLSSYTNPKYETMDPENRMLWRANVRRLDFEAIRDSLLVFSGRIDRTIGGQPVNLTDEPYSYRRSVYGYIDRGNLPELMSHFDFANPDMPNSSRTTTIVPQQALFLMNSPMAVDVARRVIARPEFTQAGLDIRRVNAIYNILFQRQAKKAEVDMAMSFISSENRKQAEATAGAKDLIAAAQKRSQQQYDNMMGRNDGSKAIQNEGKLIERKVLNPWETYTQALLFSNELTYVN